MEKSGNCNEFDQLYADLCNSLREMGKAATICQLIKDAKSDLNRIAILNKDCNIVPKLIKTIKKCKENNLKNSLNSRKTLEAYYAEKRKRDERTGESDNLIRLLNSALSHVPIDEKLDYQLFQLIESSGIMSVENLLVDCVEISGSDEDSLLSEIYRERANCFNDMGDHKMTILESLRSILYAKFNRNNPHEHLFLLLFRISTSLRHLNQWKEATAVVQFSIKLLRTSALENAKKSVETMRLVKLLKEIQLIPKDVEEKPLNFKSFLEPKKQIFPKLFHSISDTLVNTSSCLELKYHCDRGRHLIAQKTIPPGSTVIVEDPFSWIIHPNESNLYCQNCCQEVRNTIPCSKCPTAIFCSEKCRGASEAYHQYECEFMSTLSSSTILGDMALLCYRTISKTDVRLLESHIREFMKLQESGEESLEHEQMFQDKFILGFNEQSKLDSSNYGAVFAQTPNTDMRLGGDLLKRGFSAIVFTICLRLTGYFKSVEEIDSECILTETEELIASLFLRHLQSASCNAYGINKVNGSDPRRLQIDEIGGATYPIISTTNHSCNSNVYRFTIGKTCVVKALREIKSGEEILDSYGPHFASNTIEERSGLLKGQYMFNCCCSSCTENWSVYSQLPKESPCLKCTKCSNGLCSKKKEKLICSGCGNVSDARKFFKTVTDCGKQYQDAKELLLAPNKDSKINYQNIQDSIVAYQNILARSQKWPCQVLIECQETLKLCWNLQNAMLN